MSGEWDCLPMFGWVDKAWQSLRVRLPVRRDTGGETRGYVQGELNNIREQTFSEGVINITMIKKSGKYYEIKE